MIPFIWHSLEHNTGAANFGGSDGKEPACNAGDPGSIPGSGRSPREGNGNPLQYSCPENSMDRGAWCGLQSMGLQRVRHDWSNEHFRFFKTQNYSNRWLPEAEMRDAGIRGYDHKGYRLQGSFLEWQNPSTAWLRCWLYGSIHVLKVGTIYQKIQFDPILIWNIQV